MGQLILVRRIPILAFALCLWLGAAGQTCAADPSDAPPLRKLQLPSVPLNYSKIELPKHYLEHSDALDNTPADNPITDWGATLGRVLFYDKSLSANESTSCASCHQQAFAFTDPSRFSEGFQGGLVARNSMSLIDLRYYQQDKYFWDERVDGLESQVLEPIQNAIEMGHQLPTLVEQLEVDPLYPDLFAKAFGSESITSERIAKALAQFLRSIVSYRSKYDIGRATVSEVIEEFPNFSAVENRGKELFFGEARCAICHVMQLEQHPLATFQIQASQLIDADYDAPSGDDVEDLIDRLTSTGWSQTAFFWMKEPLVNGIDGSLQNRDAGAGVVGANASPKGSFKSPSLKNVELTGPYMHDGRFKTLDAVMEHYNWSVKPHPNLDPRIADLPARGLAFQQSDADAIVAFLKTLTDHELIRDERYADPFQEDAVRLND